MLGCENGPLRLTVFHDLFKGDLKPFGVAFGVVFHVLLDGFEAHVFPGSDFFGVDDRSVVGMAEPHVVVFVFDEAESHRGLIYKGEDLVHLDGHAHLLHEAAGGGLLHGLALLRMAAAGVGPQAGGVVFGEGTLLQQEFAFGIEDEYREGAVKLGHNMRRHLLHDAYLGVVMINKNYVFHVFNYGLNRFN